MAPIVYHTDISPPGRAVLLTASALGLDVDVKEVDIFAKQHLTPEFLKINPQHTVPTLDDNGFIVWDSHAIVAYLVDNYGTTDSLYPKDLKKRAIVNQRMNYDCGVLFPSLKGVYVSSATTFPSAN
ncbi:Glutathione S transferase E12 [Carabus blaptoides fortunei]